MLYICFLYISDLALWLSCFKPPSKSRALDDF